jgi:hypothetical protein
MTEEDILRYCGRHNTTGEAITKKNPGAGTEGTEDKIFSLSGVGFCNP